MEEFSNFNNGIGVIIAAIIALIGTFYSILISRKNAKSRLEGDQDLTYLSSQLKKIEQIEASRRSGYEDIWALTGALNLFGPPNDVEIMKFSGDLRDWYFRHGMFMGKASKKRYFLIQEVLHFTSLKEMTFQRPSNEFFYGDERRPLQVLVSLRKIYHNIQSNQGDVELLEKYVTNWKVSSVTATKQAEKNWVLLQFLLSKFRFGLTEEMNLLIRVN